MTGFRLLDSLTEVDAGAWDALHDGGNPFLAHALLAGLESTGCLRPDWGWPPRHATLWRDGRLIAAAPGYLKSNSHGEFVFDHVWAEAYQRAGGRYYPKWLIGIPYTPVTGPRLLAADNDTRRALLALRPAKLIVTDLLTPRNCPNSCAASDIGACTWRTAMNAGSAGLC